MGCPNGLDILLLSLFKFLILCRCLSCMYTVSFGVCVSSSETPLVKDNQTHVDERSRFSPLDLRSKSFWPLSWEGPYLCHNA